MNKYTVKLNDGYISIEAESFEIQAGDLIFKVDGVNTAGCPHGSYEWVKLESPTTP